MSFDGDEKNKGAILYEDSISRLCLRCRHLSWLLEIYGFIGIGLPKYYLLRDYFLCLANIVTDLLGSKG